MKPKPILFLLAMFIVLLPALAPEAAFATVRYVAPTTDACGSLTPCYTSIQTAVTASVSNDSVKILASDIPYTENITLPSDLAADFTITISGTETARTVLSGGGSGTVITASNHPPSTSTLTVNIWNVTITNAATGILASDKVSLVAKNNVFHSLTTAIQTVSPQSSVNIYNNTFYANTTAISRDTTTPSIINNIFSGNIAAAISPFDTINLDKNNYYNNGDDATPREGTAVSCDPSFVNISNGDFHLQTAVGCCINSGNPITGNDSIDNSSTDIGAYGGSQSDIIPFRVSGVTATATGGTVTVNWTENLAYTVTGYNIYYDATPGTHSIKVDAGALPPFDVAGLSGATAPGAPVLNQPLVANQALILSWSAASGATGYRVRYGISSTDEQSIDVGNVVSYVLQGLTNGQTYVIAVEAYAQATYYFSVTAYDSAASTPGESHESAYSTEVVVTIGGSASGLLSNVVSGYPEFITAMPNLQNKGCFIATAAYGHYSAPQVRALRKFRDEYLLTNDGGRAFVRWYYEHGPKAARYLDEHPRLKPVVRAALLPAVGGAMFLTGTSRPVKTAVALFLLIGAGSLLAYRRMFVKTGGRR